MHALTIFIRALTMAALGLSVLAGTAAAAVPAAPTNLTATTGSGVINLAWTDNANDESGFRVERCVSTSCVFGQIAVLPAGAVTFVDTYPAHGNVYRVTAYNASGSSAYTNTVNPNFGGLSVSDTRAVAAATPVSGVAPLTVGFDGSASHALYEFIAYDWSFGDGLTDSGVQVSHTYTTPGVYTATLRVTTGGPFPYRDGNPVTITVTAPPLTAVSDLSASNTTRGQILLTWTNPPSSATSLAVERCSGASCTSFRQVSTLTLASVFYKDTSVRRGTTYRYRLAAANGTNKVYSNIVTSQAR